MNAQFIGKPTEDGHEPRASAHQRRGMTISGEPNYWGPDGRSSGREETDVPVGETATRWCVKCGAELPPPIRDPKAIQLCGQCGAEQPS